MNRFLWKKSVVILTISALALTSTFAFPRRAQAFVGASALNPALMIVGAAYVLGVGAGGAGIIAGAFLAARNEIGGGIFATLAICAAIAGIVILDKDQGVYTYQEMSAKAAMRLGIKEENRIAYNAELDKINLLSRTVTEQLSLERNPTVETSMAIWKQYQDRLSPEAAVGFQKLNQSVVSASLKHSH